MKLCDKLNSLSKQETVAELRILLQAPRVRISWGGQRIVSFGDYEGSVTIDAFAKKYLEAHAFDRQASPSLQERLDCYELWDRVKQLYMGSHLLLRRTALYKYLVPLREVRPYCQGYVIEPMAIIEEWRSNALRNSLFEFTPQEFRRLWPWGNPCEVTTKWRATQEMVESAQKLIESLDPLAEVR